MARKALEMIDDGGIYSHKPWAEEKTWTEIRRGAREIRVTEPLMGWGKFKWAVEVDGRVYFLAGSAEPQERVAPS